METNDIKLWIVPEGYEIDKEQSTERQIVLKKIEDKRVSSWEEYCELMKGKDSYYFNEAVKEIHSTKFNRDIVLSEFEDKEDVEALVAFCKLRKMRKQWIGKNWKPDWTNYDQMKFTIHVEANEIIDCVNTYVSRSMCFPTEDMCNEFIDTFRDLLEIAKPLL